jgi:hypothetical protein
MQVHMRIRRFNPEKDSVPWWGETTPFKMFGPMILC